MHVQVFSGSVFRVLVGFIGPFGGAASWGLTQQCAEGS